MKSIPSQINQILFKSHIKYAWSRDKANLGKVRYIAYIDKMQAFIRSNVGKGITNCEGI